MSFKMLKKYILITSLIFNIFIITSCGDNYEVYTKVWYSDNGGETYRDGLKEYSVNSTVYAYIDVKITTNSEKGEDIDVELVIPKTTDYVVRLVDGPEILMQEDISNNCLRGKFTTIASSQTKGTPVVLQFKSTGEAEARITIRYGDKISDSANYTSAIFFVE